MTKDARASGGAGGEISTEGEAVQKARAAAADLVGVLIGLAKKPSRNAKAQVDAIRLVLEVAGINAQPELLRKLRGKVSREAYAEVVGALSEDAGVPERGTDADRGGASTDAP